MSADGKLDIVLLTEDILDVGAISASVTHATTGATALFVGTTRDNFQGKRVVRLEYEAYEGMAKKQLSAVCAELRARLPGLHSIAIHHRLGVVGVTEASVVIAVSSPHRRDALEAVEHGIERLKAVAPIWKKEVYTEGEGQWKANRECTWAPAPPHGP
jgi:molybdopterin synthase catalytic subunit